MRHTPWRAAQVSGERTLTRSIPSASMRSMATSSSSSLRATICSPLFSSTIQGGHAADQAVDERLRDLGRLLAGDPGPEVGAAIVLAGDDVLRHVHQAPGQVPGVGGAQRGVGEPLRAPWLEMKYSSTLIPSRRLLRIGRSMIRPDGSAISPRIPASWCTWVTPPRAGVGDHPDRALLVEAVEHLFGDVVGRAAPDVDGLGVALVLGDEAAPELAVDLRHLGVGGREQLDLLDRHADVVDADRDAGHRRVVEAEALDAVHRLAWWPVPSSR